MKAVQTRLQLRSQLEPAKRAVEEQPSDAAVVLKVLANLYRFLGRFDDAEKLYLKLLESKPGTTRNQSTCWECFILKPVDSGESIRRHS